MAICITSVLLEILELKISGRTKKNCMGGQTMVSYDWSFWSMLINDCSLGTVLVSNWSLESMVISDWSLLAMLVSDWSLHVMLVSDWSCALWILNGCSIDINTHLHSATLLCSKMHLGHVTHLLQLHTFAHRSLLTVRLHFNLHSYYIDLIPHIVYCINSHLYYLCTFVDEWHDWVKLNQWSSVVGRLEQCW